MDKDDETTGSDAPDFEVGVIGAGFAGLIAGLSLMDAGRTSFMIFERGATVGGVWRDNVYPGCACDVRSHLYSIASRPNPDWPAAYARQADILAYLQNVAARSGLQRHIRCDTEIVEASYVETARLWRLTDARGGTMRVRTLILALGPLNRPSLPSIPGLGRFGGTHCHSSAWDGSVALGGKRVAVIGTGASAVQIVPNIAAGVASLTVFQRSAAWVLPRGDRPSGALQRWLFRRFPSVQALVRGAMFWALEAVGSAFFGNAAMLDFLKALALRKLAREVRDPATRRALTPDHALGCKRPTVSDDFLPTFNQPNVTLVTDPIAEITPTGVRTRGGAEHVLDHIVFATGFFVADPDDYLKVVGLGGRVLAEQWARQGAQAHRGVTVAGYPNLAMLLGPNSGLSYSSVIGMAEAQMGYVLAWLDARDRAGGDAALDVRGEVQAAYNGDVQARFEGTVWASGCRSWYLDRAGRNAVIWPAPAHRYRRMMARFDAQAYRVLDRRGPPLPLAWGEESRVDPKRSGVSATAQPPRGGSHSRSA